MGLSGMFIMMLNSGANFGSLGAIHLYLTGIWGWHISAILGLALQAVLIILFPKFI